MNKSDMDVKTPAGSREHFSLFVDNVFFLCFVFWSSREVGERFPESFLYVEWSY